MTQTRTWQRKLIQAAQANGNAHQLRWFVEMEARSGGKLVRQAVTYPHGWIPTVPVDENADVWVHILVALLKAANPDKIFRAMLTDTIELEHLNLAYYTWGDTIPEVDAICSICGMVGAQPPGMALGCSKGCMT